MTIAVPNPTSHAAYKSGAVAFVVAAATILAALGFEYLGGYRPCPMCLEERYAYYAGVPLLFLALVLLSADQRRAAWALFVIVALAFLANTAFGVYHAGAELGFWPGPASCSGAQELTTSAGNLLDSLAKTEVIRCDVPAVLVLGISLAGWNAVISLFIALMSVRAAFESLRTR